MIQGKYGILDTINEVSSFINGSDIQIVDKLLILH